MSRKRRRCTKMRYVENKHVTFMLLRSELTNLGFKEIDARHIIRLEDCERFIKCGEWNEYILYHPINEEVVYGS